MRAIGMLAQLCVILLMTQSCAHRYYSPNLLNIPHLEGRNSGAVSIDAIGGFNHGGYSFQSAYSPVKYLALMCNGYQTTVSSSEYNNKNNTDKVSLLEGGVGLYLPVPDGSLSLFSGYGEGHVASLYSYTSRSPNLGELVANVTPTPFTPYSVNTDFKINRYFIQSAYSYRDKKLPFEASIGLRVTRLDFVSGNIDTRITSYEQSKDDYVIIKKMLNGRPYWTPEMGGSVGIHLRPCSLAFSGACALHSNDSSDLRIAKLTVGISLVLHIEDLFAKKQKTVPDNDKK
jgi:hypothetical protein